MFNQEAGNEAMEMLDEIGVLYRVVSDHQIKLGRCISYDPSKGSIFIDGERGARAEKGLAALRDLVQGLGLASRKRS